MLHFLPSLDNLSLFNGYSIIVTNSFKLTLYPFLYHAYYQEGGVWDEHYIEKAHYSPSEEMQLGEDEYNLLLKERNNDPHFPIINYTNQYGLGCFEGLKAYPHPDGTLHLFRIKKNAERMEKSMRGICMPPFPQEQFVKAVSELISRNYRLGFYPQYDPNWEKSNFLNAFSVYIRPFASAEAGIGLRLSKYPTIIIATTPVGSYLPTEREPTAITTDCVRATPNGTGWIKSTANYLIPIIAKSRAIQQGYTEPIFLDYKEQKYVEECASCNIFFYLKNNTLVTPELGDRILAGITRLSILELARSEGIAVEERLISIDEVLSDAKECFITGTAVGISHLASIRHRETQVVFNHGRIGELSERLRNTLKGIQYGAIEDRFGWLHEVPTE